MHKKKIQRVLGHRWLAVPLLLIGCLLLLTGLLFFAVLQTSKAIAFTKLAQFDKAVAASKPILPLVTTVDYLTLSLVPDLDAWKTVLLLPSNLQKLSYTGREVINSFANENTDHSLTELLNPINELSASLENLNDLMPKTWFIQKTVPQVTQSLIASLPTQLSEVSTVLTKVGENKQTWVFVFQNSNELRATGGFPGSYGLLELNDGKLSGLVIEDIYDADGQFQGYIAPPAGIREYTSGARGLRLPDANWWPDFPLTARTMLQFFALGDKRNISGLVMINIDTAKSMLRVTGPLYLPDYNIEVTEANIDEVLRAQRDTFFPGSRQKKHILEQTISQLKNKLSQLSPEQQYELAVIMLDQIKRKEIQIYSNQPEIQELLTKYGVSGAVGKKVFAHSPEVQLCNCEPVTLMLVESNVGINKVNKYVERTIQLSFDTQYATISAHFTNNAVPMTDTELSSLLQTEEPEQRPRNGNGYLNYYRLLISPEYSVSEVSVGGVPQATWDDELITTSTGDTLRQVGVLLAVPEQQTNSIKISLTSARTLAPEVVLIPKQSGLAPSTYLVTTSSGSQEFQLVRDTVVSFN